MLHINFITYLDIDRVREQVSLFILFIFLTVNCAFVTIVFCQIVFE